MRSHSSRSSVGMAQCFSSNQAKPRRYPILGETQQCAGMPIVARLTPTDWQGKPRDAALCLVTPLKNTTDGLRGFEVTDPDGYVLSFGRPKYYSRRRIGSSKQMSGARATDIPLRKG
jgi:hypothetical protein